MPAWTNLATSGFKVELMRWPSAILRQQPLYRIPMHIRQPVIPALEPEDELRVLDPQAAQDGGVVVVDVDRILDDVVAVVVGLAVADAGLDAAAGQPHGEAAAVVV